MLIFSPLAKSQKRQWNMENEPFEIFLFPIHQLGMFRLPAHLRYRSMVSGNRVVPPQKKLNLPIHDDETLINVTPIVHLSLKQSAKLS